MWKEGRVAIFQGGPLWKENWTMRKRCPYNDLGEEYSPVWETSSAEGLPGHRLFLLKYKKPVWVSILKKRKVEGEAIRERQGANNSRLLRPLKAGWSKAAPLSHLH